MNDLQGPFGRVLPVPDDHEVPDHVLGPIDETRFTTMATYNLPRPALDFGSDNRGFTDPLRYSSQRIAPTSFIRHERSDSSEEPTRSIEHDLLPGVSQLLTPASHSSVSTSTQSPHLVSPSSAQVTEISRADTQQTHQSNHQLTLPPRLPKYVEPITAARNNYSVGLSSRPPPPPPPPAPPSIPPTLFTNPPLNPTPHSTYFGQTHELSYVSQILPQTKMPMVHSSTTQPRPSLIASSDHLSRQSFHMTPPVQAYVAGPSSAAIDPAAGLEQSERSTGKSVKLTPRVVREDVLPGEGPVWVYEDGSMCPKVIDGEVVNAEWGITKAGKPRKRLAIACTTCREKKIKCHPALPKCSQCSKFGRECHYATA